MTKSGFIAILAISAFCAASAQAANNYEYLYVKQIPGFVPAGYTDTAGPQMASVSPASGATGVSVGTSLAVNFDEDISKGTGNIEVSNGEETFASIAVSSDTVSVAGQGATISLPLGMAYGTTYEVFVPVGAFVDGYGNVSEAVSWSFTTNEGVSTISMTPTEATLDIVTTAVAGNEQPDGQLSRSREVPH